MPNAHANPTPASLLIWPASTIDRSPERISYDEVVDWVHHLIRERHLAPSSVNIAVNGVRFLYGVTLHRDVDELVAAIPHMKRNTTRAQVYAKSELEAILTAPTQPRDRAFLMTVYAGGLRLSEAIHLQTRDIDRPRMQLRVRNGKGAKERVLPLSSRLLSELESYWRAQRSGRPGHESPWLFLGSKPDQPINKATGQNIYYRALKKSGVRRMSAATEPEHVIVAFTAASSGYGGQWGGGESGITPIDISLRAWVG